MAKYCIITHDEMHQFLSDEGFQPVQLPGVREAVYQRTEEHPVSGRELILRVYTSIVPGHGSRQRGDDAIRVGLFQDGPRGVSMFGIMVRVHRVTGWRRNLSDRLESWHELLGPCCPACGSDTVRRKSRRGLFWGCSRYPECRGIIDVGGKQHAAKESA